MARKCVAIALALMLAPVSVALASPPAEQDKEPAIEERVARALYDRAMVLFGTGDVHNARALFSEAIEKDPGGPMTADAQRMIGVCDERLELQDGLSSKAPGGSPSLAPPVAAGGAAERDEAVAEPDISRIGLAGWSAGYGMVLGLAAFGPTEDDANGEDTLSTGAALAGAVTGASLAGLSYWLTGRYALSDGQHAAIATAGTWAAVSGGLLGDVITGDDSDTNDIFKATALGGALGIGGGILYALKRSPSVGEIAFANSFAAYGATAGLFFGVFLSPPEGEAYALNASLGALAGLGIGALLGPRAAMSRARTLWLDVGAAVGVAASWVVLYPMLADGGTDNDEQITGLVSTLALGGGVATAWWLTSDMDSTAPMTRPAPSTRLPAPIAPSWRSGTRWVVPLVSQRFQ